MPKTKQDFFRLITARKAEIRSFGIKQFGVFGSFIRDEATPQSDVDVLVEFETGQENFRNFSNLVFLLEEAFERPVDLLTPDSLSPFIGPRILAEVEYGCFS